MAKEKLPVVSFKRFQGIADYPKESSNGQIPNTYYFGRAINFRDDPQSLTLLPGALKESGSVVTDLLKAADIVPVTLTSYLVGSTGNFYSRSSTGVWTNLYAIPQTHGNGLAYFSGDDYVYVSGDISLSRYGPAQGTPSFTSNFLKAQGGVPQNIASILLTAASSMYGHAADSASLSVTGDITLETYFKANSLPAVGSSMTLVGKWNESGTTMSYKMDLFGVSGYFGNGGDLAITISSNTTEAPIDSACTGTSGLQALTATNLSFAIGQVILIHQTQGTNAGQWERNTIQGYTAGTITLGTPLLGTYTTGAQVRVLKQYTNVTINAGVTYTAKAWNGTTGGILAFLANGTLTVAATGKISADACGYRGGGGSAFPGEGQQGESELGIGGANLSASGVGGGGGGGISGNAVGGNAAGDTTDLTTALFGGGGGGNGYIKGGQGSTASGGTGGGLIMPWCTSISNSGTISSQGQFGSVSTFAGGSGAGGPILLKCQTLTNSGTITTAGAGSQITSGNEGGHNGAGGGHATNGSNGGNNNTGGGADGRIAIDYLTSITNSGTFAQTPNEIQDNTLVTTTTIQVRLGISSNGSTVEYLTQNLNTLTTGTWNRLSISWTASTSTASFYLNAVLLGTSVGTKTAIHDNASLLTVGANNSGSGIGNYFDGLINDMRIWNNVQTASQIFANLNQQVPVASSGLVAYYKFNSAATDATANSNNLTLVNSPTYSTDVPFAAPTTRLDIDVNQNLTGQTYTLLTSISEASVDTITFTPVTDPQASVGFWVNAKGTGDWTVTVHDQQNRVIATQTILNASIPIGGFVEFIYTSAWRLTAGAKYHMHLTVSTGTSSVVTGTVSNLSTAEYTTYFQFLVTDTQFHPLIQFQYQPLGGTLTGALIIGNERYIAVWDGSNFLPNFISFPPGWHIRCFAFWRNYLAVGMWRGGAITDFDRGRIYFWSGYQPAFDFFIDVPEGQINAMFGIDSDLYFFAGYRGILLDYKGGFFYNTGNSTSNKLKRMPLLSQSDYTEVYPGALTMWRGFLHFGLYANSNSTTVQKGVYSFGTLNQFYPDTLSYDYVISTGNKSTSVSLGLVYAVGQNLIIGWQDGIAYGADVINFSNPPAASGELQTLILDNDSIWKDTENLKLKANFLPLKSGESIDVEYSLDRGSFVTSPIDSTVGDIEHGASIGGGRANEIQVGLHLYATGTTSPTALGLSLLQNPLDEEEQF